MFAFTPGPTMFRLCEALPLSTATNVYVPGLKLVLDKAMWNSVSVAITLVPLAEELPPEAGLEVERPELDEPGEPDEQPAASSATVTMAVDSAVVGPRCRVARRAPSFGS